MEKLGHLKKRSLTLVSVTQLVGASSYSQKVVGLTLDPGVCGRQPIDVFLSH